MEIVYSNSFIDLKQYLADEENNPKYKRILKTLLDDSLITINKIAVNKKGADAIKRLVIGERVGISVLGFISKCIEASGEY